MEIERLLAAADVLGELSARFSALPEERTDAVIASLQFTLVRIYLLEVVRHLQNGVDPYDALLNAAKGNTTLAELGVSDSTQTVLDLLAQMNLKK